MPTEYVLKSPVEVVEVADLHGTKLMVEVEVYEHEENEDCES